MALSLDEWLDYQQRTHPQAIAMGLDRVRVVARRLGLGHPGRQVITVGGTNGKGSTVAFIEAIALSAGLRVGAFTSPHLLRYNERVRIQGKEIDDAALVNAFERIEDARAEVPLTYFEFGTLAALLVFEQSNLDLAVLEVGLGGKLDAVNIVDADVAVITTVDLDHQEYLGPDRETIGADKAGIFRAGKPCVLGERDPPS
ncbi:MAG: Mur ligase family protein, partial [Gammaproteobacteria bacterium]|nr:Mur ligase family protein [Gammaproteobacteria bacterium]